MSLEAIIQKYEEILSEYYKESQIIIDRYIKEKRRPYTKLLKGIYEFYIFCSYLLDEKIIKPSAENDIILGLYSKSCLSLYGIYSCLKDGLASEAASLLRNLFETYLNVKLILEFDSDYRIRLFNDFKYVQRYLSIKQNQDLLSKGLITEERFEKTYPKQLIDETYNKYDEIKDNYHPKIPYSWAWAIFKDKINGKNPSVRTIAIHLGEEFDYVKLYSTMSIPVHSSPLIENIIGDGKVKTLAPLFNEHIVGLSFLSLDIVGKVISELLNKYSDTQTTEEINTYMNVYFVSLYENWKNI